MKCPICKINDALYNSETSDYTFCKTCMSKISKEYKEIYYSDKINFGMPLDAIDASLDSFIPKKITSLQKATNDFKTNLLLYGASGVGKTFLVCAIINKLCDEKRISNFRFVNCVVLQHSLYNYELYDNMCSEFKKVDLLVLDEFINVLSDKNYFFMYEVLNSRKENNKQTFVTANDTISDARLLSRIRANKCVECKITEKIY